MQYGFEDMSWLFSCDNRNRGIVRMNFNEAATLWKSVRLTDGPILEIGRMQAGSTALMAAASNGRPITSIDIAPMHNEEAEKFLYKFNNVELIIGDSRKSLNKKFGFALIDGDHSEIGVKADVDGHWNSILKFNDKEPLVVFHDAYPNDGLLHVKKQNHCDGVLKICNYLINNNYAELYMIAGSIMVLKKISDI